MKKILFFLAIFFINPVFSQMMGNGQYTPANYGTRNHFSDKNSFKYGIIGSNQDATGSPVGLVSAIIRRVPSAKKVSDRFGNASVSLRGRNSVQTAGDEVLWDIDGVTYLTPPMLSINEVVYVEVVKGLAANNKYGSDGAGGVIIVKTSVSASNNELINSPRNLWRTVTEKRIRIKKN
ncbi:TonB-dependent receptor plug domain-containing protein [Flavobacteriaceae bacterium]|nr:TonB-dependent receptor plug domain-containing protein [Flavobacteriaceae bacterium]